MKKRDLLARVLLATLLGLVLAFVLLRTTGSADRALRGIFRNAIGADPAWLSLGAGLFLLSQVARALRWRTVTFRRTLPMRLLLPLTSVHIGLGHVLPVRLSDVAWVALARKLGSLPVGDGAASVAISKLMDLMAMGLVVGGAVALSLSGTISYLGPVLLFAAGAGGIVLMPALLKLLERPVRFLLRRSDRALSWYSDLRGAMVLRNRFGRLFAALALSIVAWVCKLAMFACLLTSTGVTGIPLWKVFVASAITDLTMALPVHGFFSMGTVETGWVAGFALVGITEGVVERGFTVHLLWVFLAVAISALALPWLIAARRGRAANPDPDRNMGS